MVSLSRGSGLLWSGALLDSSLVRLSTGANSVSFAASSCTVTGSDSSIGAFTSS